MTGTPLDLLALVRAGSSLLAPAKVTPAQVEGANFADLLRTAENGQIASGREVTVGKGVELTLTREQAAGLAAAADRAEASGAQSVMVLMDGLALKLDVGSRTIVGKADLASGQVVTGVDAVVSLPGKDGSATPPIVPYPRAGAGLNPSLARALERPAA